MNPPIDLIVTWVNGRDPDWLREKANRLGYHGDDRMIRYRDWGLMKYWFRGVEAFLPWIRRIHFVTWGHLPEGIRADHPKLHIVNHRDYIPSEYLPTFNSNVIELNFFRIPDLSEQFILANDDFYFIRPLTPSFFFRNGLPVDAAIQTVLQFSRPDGIDDIVKNNLLALNMNFQKKEVIRDHKAKWFSPRYGKDFLRNLYMQPFTNFTGFSNPHVATGYLKSVLEEVYHACQGKMVETFSHPIRTGDDINIWLCRYWQFVTGRFCPGNPHRGSFCVIGRDDENIRRIFKSQSEPTVCLSDDDETVDFEKEKSFLKKCFKELLPEKSSFEY